MTYAGQEAQLSMVVFIFSKQPSLADVICWVRVSKFLATNTASLILTFLSKSENEEIKIGKIKHYWETKMVKKRNKLTLYMFCVRGTKERFYLLSLLSTSGRRNILWRKRPQCSSVGIPAYFLKSKIKTTWENKKNDKYSIAFKFSTILQSYSMLIKN